jgi:orotate phosphoribosyltransferase
LVHSMPLFRIWNSRRVSRVAAKELDLASRIREAALLEGDFVLSSGKKSRVYVDKYLFSTEPDLLRDLAHEISARLPTGTQRLAGVELGAVPLVTAVALHSNIPYSIVRKATKEYGTSNRIEGRAFEAGERITLIEDVVTTGAQALKSAAALEEAGAKVLWLLAVLDRREEDSTRLGNYPFGALFRMEDLVR